MPDVELLTGIAPDEIDGAARAGAWWVSEALDDLVAGAVGHALEDFHRAHPLRRVEEPGEAGEVDALR